MPPRRGQRRAEEQRQEPGPLQELLAEINAEPDHNSEDEDGGDLDVPELPCAPDGSRTGRLSREELAALATEAKRQQEKSTSRTYKNNLKWFKEWGGPRGLSPENFDVPDAVRFYSDVLQAMQRDADSCNYPKALNTIKGWHSALQDVWKQKCMSLSDLDAANSPNHMKLLDYPTYKTAYHNLQKYVSSLTPSDPTRGTAADSYTPEEFAEMMETLYQRSGRNMDTVFWQAVEAFMHQCVARSDDARLAKPGGGRAKEQPIVRCCCHSRRRQRRGGSRAKEQPRFCLGVWEWQRRSDSAERQLQPTFRGRRHPCTCQSHP